MELQIEYKDKGWWYWLVTWVLLVALMVFGWAMALYLNIILQIVQVVDYRRSEGSVKAFPVQIRIGFLIFLVVGALEFMRWIYWIPVVGVAAQLTVGYCLMARVMSLMPWNLQGPFTWYLFKKTIFSKPVKGSILRDSGTAETTEQSCKWDGRWISDFASAGECPCRSCP